MTFKEAKAIMLDFAERHCGNTVVFGGLSDEDKLAFVLIDTFDYFKFLPPAERIERTIRNAEIHRKNGFVAWNAMGKLEIIEG